MQIIPNYIAIGKMFEQNFLFEVPKYQRYYAWEDEQIKDYIKDIDNLIYDETLEHFLGGIVCVSKVVTGSTRQQKELIDGQQRITTTILLISNIIKKYTELSATPDLSEDDKKLISTRIEKLTTKYLIYNDEINRTPIKVYKLVLSLADKQFFESIIKNQPTDPSRDSHRKILSAAKLLNDFLSKKIDICPTISDKIDILDNIEKVIQSRLTVIFMDCDSRTSAYKLFQVLNDRGSGLNEGDLLKSKTLEALLDFSNEQEQAETYWDEILKEEPSKVESFLRTYYASHCGKRAGRTSLYDDFLSKFFPKLSNGEFPSNQDEATLLLNSIYDIYHEAELYRKITTGIWPFAQSNAITDWDRNRLSVLVKFLSYDITLPLLLSATKLSEKKFAELVHKLEKFMFRYKTICGNSHQVLSELYNSEAKKIRDNPSVYSFATLFTELRTLLAEKSNNELFSVRLKNLKYSLSGGNKTLRYFFSTLCDYYRWYSTGANGNPNPDGELIINYDNVTVEHIDSQNPAHPNVIPESDTHNLFNLSILSQDDNNRRVKNKPFVDKKDIYNSSQYKINQKLVSYDNWSIENANDWQDYITEFACIIFTI